MPVGDVPAGTRLDFRPLRRDDLPFLLEVRNECRDWLHDNREFTLDECEVWFEQARPDFRLILLDGAPIGYFRLSNHDPDARSIYVGADLHNVFRGKGLGRAIFERFIPVIVAQFGVTELKLEVLSHNARALHLYHALGFKETGRHRDFGMREGRSVDAICMTLNGVTSGT